MNELQPSIEEKETTGQLFAVLPLAAVTADPTPSGEGEDEPSASPQHDTPAGDDKEDITTGQLMPHREILTDLTLSQQSVRIFPFNSFQ